MRLPIVPVAIIPRTIGVRFHAVPVVLAIFPLTLVHGTVRPEVRSPTMHLVHQVVTLVLAPICVRENTLASTLAVLPFTLIFVSIRKSESSRSAWNSFLIN